MAAAGPWIALSEQMPPLHNQVLVRLRGGAGFVADVACYIGKQDDGTGKQLERWILADVSLQSRQITHWAELHDVEAA
jgi:hypothetical protein